MVELLLNSVDELALCESSTASGQNMWHILADFKPFDRDIWLDYIDEFVSKVKAANPPLIKDSFGRTPLHYAAMHGQDLLLDRLIQFNAIGVNYYDIDGKSELDYAVESCQMECLTVCALALMRWTQERRVTPPPFFCIDSFECWCYCYQIKCFDQEQISPFARCGEATIRNRCSAAETHCLDR